MKITRFTHRYVVSLSETEMTDLRALIDFALSMRKSIRRERRGLNRWEDNPLGHIDQTVDKKPPSPEARQRGALGRWADRDGDLTGT